MARLFGSTGASSLMRASAAGLNKTNTYNDALASYEFDVSAKSSEDYAKYQSYLNGRIAKTQNSDPSKALSLTRTATSANRTFNSAEISRATTAVKYGDISNRDKYGQMAQLYQAAVKNGDDNLAQSLDSQLASLTVTIQNEDQAAANKAEASNHKTLAANKLGIDQAVGKYDQWVKLAKDQVQTGKMSVQDYEAGIAQAMEGKRQALDQAANGKLGGITPEAAQSYSDKSIALTTSDQYTGALAKYPEAMAGNPAQYLSIDPARHSPDGSLLGALTNRPAGKTELKKDANGNDVYVHTYGGGFQGNEDAKSRQDFVNKGGQYIFNQVGQLAKKGPNGEIIQRDGGGRYYISTDPQTGAPTKIRPDKPTPVGGTPIKDDKGNYFVVDQNGTKHMVTTDPNAALQRWRPQDTGTPDFGSKSGLINPFSMEAVNSVGGAVSSGARAAGKLLTRGRGIPGVGPFMQLAGGALNSIFRQSDVAQQAAATKALQDRVAAQNATKDAATLASSRQLLPAFQPPPPIAPPKITPQPSQYNLPALPAPVPVSKGSTFNVPSGTGNYQKDVLNLGRSLGGLL